MVVLRVRVCVSRLLRRSMDATGARSVRAAAPPASPSGGRAGLASLAIQLGESALKLKSLYDRFKDAPSSLSTISHDLETLALLLQELEIYRRHHRYDDLILGRCITRCRKVVNRVSVLIENMGGRIKSRVTVGRMYTALKDKDMTRLLLDLEEAKSLLMLALQQYQL